MLNVLTCIVSSALVQLSSWSWSIFATAALLWPTSAAVFASRSPFACCASQAPTLRPAMVMVMSPCFEVIFIVPLYSVRAVLYVVSRTALPSGQLMAMCTLLPDCLKSVTLHLSLPCDIAFFASPFSVHTLLVRAPMLAGSPGMFICVLTSQSSSLPAANADAPKASATASANILCIFFPLVEPRANYDLCSVHAGCTNSRRDGFRRQRRENLQRPRRAQGWRDRPRA